MGTLFAPRGPRKTLSPFQTQTVPTHVGEVESFRPLPKWLVNQSLDPEGPIYSETGD